MSIFHISFTIFTFFRLLTKRRPLIDSVSSILFHDQVTILYIFTSIHLIDFLVVELSCIKINGQYQQRYYQDLACFDSVLTVFAKIYCALALGCIYFNAVFAAYFYYRFNFSDPPTTLRMNMNPEMLAFHSILIPTLLTNFLGIEYAPYIAKFYSISSCVVVYACLQKHTFVSEKLRRYNVVCYFIPFWFSIAFTLKTISTQNRNDLLTIFFFLLPFVLAVIYYKITARNTPKTKIMNKNIASWEEELEKIETLIQVYKQKDSIIQMKYLLHSFVDQHQQCCIIEDCPLSFNKSINIAALKLGKFSSKKYHKAFNSSFKEFIMQEYIRAIKQYPNSLDMRLSFAYYLTDMMGMKNQALDIAKSSTFLADTAFRKLKMYRLFEYIEMTYTGNKLSLSVRKNEDEELRLNKIASNVRLVENLIEKTTNKFDNFWKSLKTDNLENPTLMKVIDALYPTLVQIEELFWSRYKSFQEGNPEIIKQYGLFCIFVLNNEKKGHYLIERSQTIAQKLLRSHFKIDKLNKEISIGLCSAPVALVQIKKVNKKYFFLNFFNFFREV